MIKKLTKAQQAAAEKRGAQKSKKLLPVSEREHQPVTQEPANNAVAESIETMVNSLSSMMAQHLTRFDQVMDNLNQENKMMKAELALMREEMKALKNRAVRLKPVRAGPEIDSPIHHIEVIPIQKKQIVN